MDSNHEYTPSDVGDAPTAPAKPKPKPFSMAQSHALLESKRLNTSHLSEQQNVLNTRIRMDPPQPPRKATAQAAPRVSLSHLLSNHTSARTSTPLSLLRASAPANSNERLNDRENVNSSPGFSSFESPDRAYIQQNRPFSVAPTPQRTFRLSDLQQASERPRLELNDTSAQRGSSGSMKKSQGNLKERDNIIHCFNSTFSENQQLSNENDHIVAMNAQLSRDLEDYRSNLNIINEQLSSATLEVKTIRPALALARERLAANENEIISLKANCVNTKSELDAFVKENNALKEEHTQERLENERLRTSVETTKKGIAKLLIEYATLGESFRKLKKGYDSQKSLHTAMVKEAEETKMLAKSGLLAMEPMLDDNNTIARAGETKIVLKELHNDLLASQQVTDLLRNKLHHQGSQLADAQSRISELEQEKRGSMQELLAAREDAKREYELLFALEGQIGELSTRLSERERESIDALANAAIGELELKAANERIDRYQKESESQALELVSLRKVKDENVSSLLALQDVINTRDKEIISLKADIKGLNESKSELRALLTENKKNLAEAETELRAKEASINARDRDIVSLTADRKALMESKAESQMLLSEAKKTLAEKVDELMARDPNEDLLNKIRELETTCGSLKAALEDSQEQCILRERSLKQLEFQLTKKFQDAEKANIELTSHNKSLRESFARGQDQLKNVQAELKEALNTASVTMGKCSALERAEQESRERLLAEIGKAKTELSSVQEEFNVASVRESNASGKCSVFESNIKKMEKESKVIREGFLAEIADLKIRLEAQSVNLFQSKEELASLKERVISAGEQREALQLSLDNIQSLVKAQEMRASTAESAVALAQAQAIDAKQSLANMESKVMDLTHELADTQQAANKLKSSANLKAGEQVKILEDRIAELEDTNEQLSTRAEELWPRYKDGRLSDKEKEFISYLLNEAQSIHEEDVVRKENELSRRDHAIQALNTKVSELQTIIARSISIQGSVVEAPNKSIVDVKAWLAPSSDNVPSEPHTEDVSGALFHESSANPLSRHYRDVDADSEDDIPLSELGKRSDDLAPSEEQTLSKKRIRPASPPVADGPSNPKRRTKSSIGKKVATGTIDVSPPETKTTNAKSKPKKQRK